MPLRKIAADFGISETCLQNWMGQADVEAGARPGVTMAEADELREAKKRIRLLEHENEVLRKAAPYLCGVDPGVDVFVAPPWRFRDSQGTVAITFGLCGA